MNRQFVLEVTGKSGNPELEAQLAKRMQDYFNLFLVKQHKYGPGNIALAGLPGIINRAQDKIERLKNFVFNGIKDDAEGSQLDAWMDLTGYGFIGWLFYDGVWPGASPEITWKQIWNLIGGKLWGNRKHLK